MDIDTLEHESGSYLDEKLKEQFADLVYRVDIKGHQAYITFLFEHKSTRDRMVIFQILKYMISIWESKIKEALETKKKTGNELATEDIEIPIILPIVVYHDKYKWNIKRSLGEMMPHFASLPVAVKEYIPNFEYLLADLPRLEAEGKIKLQEEHAIVIETLNKARYESKENIIDLFKRVVEIYTSTKDMDMVGHYIISTIVYIISSRNDFEKSELERIANQISKEGGELVMTLAERLMEKGRQEGRGEGETRALARTAVNLLVKKFNFVPEEMKKRISGLDAPTLDAIIDGVFEYKNLDEVKKYIQ